jgi:hypothetical protein
MNNMLPLKPNTIESSKKENTMVLLQKLKLETSLK